MSQMEEEYCNLEDEVALLTCSRSPKSKKIKKSDSLSPRKNNGHWTKEEHEKYLQFLEDHAHLKKNNKIFKPMSEIIGTRSPSQCRSHHQKFNPLSPQVQRKSVKLIKINSDLKVQTQQQEETNETIDDEKQIKNKVRLVMYDDEFAQEDNEFNLDDLI
ncbi:unnamed protein product (macronuclear) [Paramecium tetraurelia]|uniref:Myb-like domain-containing protein n=1 Tax=Paramecium tetraurelia TaxID=5888 RepID=A0DGE7_PARTE|nr:uncharacterized protein GSPATT00002243001 [Paramecium tetraurelia]CAK82114.1 unnamed protein product [Paramecium tetraurelia]|eukprot:XP_001449511.1 hypothetical protein (macronuclear) [Paramecium tetraurelia strain d4-2]